MRGRTRGSKHIHHTKYWAVHTCGVGKCESKRDVCVGVRVCTVCVSEDQSVPSHVGRHSHSHSGTPKQHSQIQHTHLVEGHEADRLQQAAERQVLVQLQAHNQ